MKSSIFAFVFNHHFCFCHKNKGAVSLAKKGDNF